MEIYIHEIKIYFWFLNYVLNVLIFTLFWAEKREEIMTISFLCCRFSKDLSILLSDFKSSHLNPCWRPRGHTLSHSCWGIRTHLVPLTSWFTLFSHFDYLNVTWMCLVLSTTISPSLVFPLPRQLFLFITPLSLKMRLL